MKFRVLLSLLALLVLCRAVIQRSPTAKRDFYIAALANQGPERYYARFSPTFTEFLNNTVGPMFDPPIAFYDTPLGFDVFIDEAQKFAVGFRLVTWTTREIICLPTGFYVHPSLCLCLRGT
jgi:hypothetical protein